MLAILTALAVQAADVPPPAIEGQGAFIGASVADIDKSARWYADTLGLRIVMQPPARDGNRMVALEGNGLLVELIQDKAAVPLRQAAPAVTRDYLVHGIFKGGVIVKDGDGLLKRLQSRNVPIAIGPFPASAEQRANLMIRDPDGNFLQFFGDYARPATAR